MNRVLSRAYGDELGGLACGALWARCEDFPVGSCVQASGRTGWGGGHLPPGQPRSQAHQHPSRWTDQCLWRLLLKKNKRF